MSLLSRAVSSFLPWRKSPKSTLEYELFFKSIDEKINFTAKKIRTAKRKARFWRRWLIKAFSGLMVAFIVILYARKPRSLTPGFLKEVGVVATFPVFFFTFQKALQWYYSRKIASLEEHLEDLKSNQDDKLAEFKEVTNFSKIYELMSKYDESSLQPKVDENSIEEECVHQSPVVNSAAAGSAEDVQKIQKRGVMDRILDFILNDGPNNRLALICSHCFTHNGLVLPEDFHTICYRCPVCGYLNGDIPAQHEQPEDHYQNEPGSPVHNDEVLPDGTDESKTDRVVTTDISSDVPAISDNNFSKLRRRR